ncbi:hypothetical protein X801_03181, partial [Opisthorchis viverrini]
PPEGTRYGLSDCTQKPWRLFLLSPLKCKLDVKVVEEIKAVANGIRPKKLTEKEDNNNCPVS